MVHIADVLARRHVPAAGLFLSLTRRCPLSCAHCSTNSTIRSEEHAAAPFVRLVESFTPQSRPEFVFLTGGEALLRLSTVRRIARVARERGSRTVLITGLFFARTRGTVPARLAEVLRTVDHVVVSHDRFHAPEVPRAHALDVVAELLGLGVDTSFQLVADGPDDRYIAETVAGIRARFGDRVPALVAPLGAAGRGAALLDTVELIDTLQPGVRPGGPPPPSGPPAPVAASAPAAAAPAPCAMAAWPTVAYDGTVVACCSQDVVDGPAPEHLVLGHAARDPWSLIAERCAESPTLRAIRTYGPELLTDRFAPGCASGGYCTTCLRIGGRPEVLRGAEQLVREPVFLATEALVVLAQTAAGPEAFARRYGVPEYAGLLTLGRPGGTDREPVGEAG